MHIPVAFHHAVFRHRARGRRVALVVRHAERGPVWDIRTHETVLLTDSGHAAARHSGGELAKAVEGAVGLYHSPVERCAQTARGLLEGLCQAGARSRLHGPLAQLATPFLRDPERAAIAAHEQGPRFIRSWFDGTLPPGIMQPRDDAAEGQLQVLGETLRRAETDICVFVTHDWNIALLRESYLGLRPDEHGWPGFLDGLVLSWHEDVLTLELEHHARAVPLPLQTTQRRKDTVQDAMKDTV